MAHVRSSAASGIFLLLLSVCLPAAADAADTFHFTGYVETENRLTIQGKSRFVFNEDTFQLAVWAYPAAEVSLLGSFRLIGVPVNEYLDSRNITVYQQTDPQVVSSVWVLLDEAYINISGLGLKNLDVKIGKQRIQWGTGDQFNPTDNLNPDDLHDALLFGKKIPSPALQTNYYIGPVTLTGVLLPYFTPVLLPEANIRGIFELQFRSMADDFVIDTGYPAADVLVQKMMDAMLPGMNLGAIDIYSVLPELTAQNISAGAKASATLGGVDFSASYAYVFDDFGVPRQVTMDILLEDLNTVNLTVMQEYPRMHVIGADFAWSIPKLSVGVWGEVAYFIPEPFPTDFYISVDTARYLRLHNILERIPMAEGFRIATEEPLADPYIKATAGFDYTFPGAYYINCQYVRGLPNENTSEMIANYVFAGVDKPFLHDSFKARIFMGYDFNDGSAILYPQLFWYPMDSLEIHFGPFFVFGALDTDLGAFGDSFVFLRARYSF